MMKKILQLILIMLPFVSMAQSGSESILSAGKAWIMYYMPDEPMYQGQNSYEEQMLGDELVKDGISFRQILRRSWRVEGTQYPNEWIETGNYIGQDANGKVYYYWKQFDIYIIVMDFSLKEGDTYYQKDVDGYVADEFIVTKVLEETFSNIPDCKPRKCFYLSSIRNSPLSEKWIEGVGSVVGGLKGASYLQWDGGGMSLYQCNENGKVIYQSPQATTCIDRRPIDVGTDKGTIYNLKGQRRSQTTSKGLYIQKGKKVVVK